MHIKNKKKNGIYQQIADTLVSIAHGWLLFASCCLGGMDMSWVDATTVFIMLLATTSLTHLLLSCCCRWTRTWIIKLNQIRRRRSVRQKVVLAGQISISCCWKASIDNADKWGSPNPSRAAVHIVESGKAGLSLGLGSINIFLANIFCDHITAWLYPHVIYGLPETAGLSTLHQNIRGMGWCWKGISWDFSREWRMKEFPSSCSKREKGYSQYLWTGELHCFVTSR